MAMILIVSHRHVCECRPRKAQSGEKHKVCFPLVGAAIALSAQTLWQGARLPMHNAYPLECHHCRQNLESRLILGAKNFCASVVTNMFCLCSGGGRDSHWHGCQGTRAGRQQEGRHRRPEPAGAPGGRQEGQSSEGRRGACGACSSPETPCAKLSVQTVVFWVTWKAE